MILTILKKKQKNIHTMSLSIFLLIISSVPLAAIADQRTALVVGNGGYKYSPLTNPINDAELISQILQNYGFNVVIRTDVNQIQMKRLIRDFEKALKVRKDVVGLFYFSGHGMQVEGRNYLIPVGEQIESESDVLLNAIPLNDVLTRMRFAGNSMNFVILDACRNNPFEKSFKSPAQGLGSVNAPKGTLISYAAQPNKVARQCPGKYSCFTESLAQNLIRSGISIRDIMLQTRIEVHKKTNGEQVPVLEDQLMSKFYFDKNLNQPYDLAKVDSKTIKKDEKKVKAVVEKIRKEYLNDYAKIDDKIKVHFAQKKCTDDPQFLAIHRGLALIFTYYYLARLSFLDLPYDQFTYPFGQLSLNEMLAGMNSDDILHNFGKYLNEIKYKDRYELRTVINQFIEYHEIFKAHVTKDNLIYLICNR